MRIQPLRLFSLFLVLMAPPALVAQGLRPIPRLETLTESAGVPAGGRMHLALRVSLPEGFHVQSNAPRDPALIPTRLTLSAPEGVTIEEILYPRAGELEQAGQTEPLAVFGPEFVVGVTLSVAGSVEPGSISIPGGLFYQACDDRVCYLPATADTAWNVTVLPAGSSPLPQNAGVFAQLAEAGGTVVTPPGSLVTVVRAAIAVDDPAEAERLVNRFRETNGITPEMLLGLSWLGRGALASGDLAAAESYARETYQLVQDVLRGRELDAEEQLPTAFGAAIEVLGQAAAARGARSEGVAFLEEQLRLYGDSSMHKRIRKNLNLLSLEGTTAPALDLSEYQGVAPPTLEQLEGRVVLLFFWAHWCSDCKAQGPVLAALREQYEAAGLTVVAPTQRYGYVAEGAAAGPDEERAYIGEIRETYYPWLAEIPVPLSEANHLRYGVSSTPTLALVDREGVVRLYHPGQMTREELEPLIQELL